MAELTELAGGLAHELRNPLSTMMVNLKLLSEDLRDERARPEDARRRALLKIDTLRREAGRLQALFDEFLRLAGPCSLHLTEVDLRQIVSRLVEFLEPTLHANKVEVTVNAPDEPVICHVDEKLLSQALLNLALNGQQAMPNGGTLRITVSVDSEPNSNRGGRNPAQVQPEGCPADSIPSRNVARESFATIHIADDGVGISEADRDLIMRPFFSTKVGGTGLGLPLTRRIIEEHGGTLTFTSAPGEGTTFTARLPDLSKPQEQICTAAEPLP